MVTDIDNITRQLIEDLEANDALKRRHANFWNFHKKTSKELGLFSEVFERFEKDFEVKIDEWGLTDKDPPDVFANVSSGKVIGIEITELVNEHAIDAQIHFPDRYSTELLSFDFDASVKKLREIVAEKGRKLASVGDLYDELVLLIHTDEFMLKSDQFNTHEHGVTLEMAPAVNRIYLLFSYEPDKQTCPLIRLA